MVTWTRDGADYIARDFAFSFLCSLCALWRERVKAVIPDLLFPKNRLNQRDPAAATVAE